MFNKRGGISSDLWHDQAFKQRNVEVMHKKERAVHQAERRMRARRNMALLRTTAKEVGSQVAMEHQLGALGLVRVRPRVLCRACSGAAVWAGEGHNGRRCVGQNAALRLSHCLVSLPYAATTATRHRLPAAALYMEMDEDSMFEDDWAQMKLVRLANNEAELLQIRDVLRLHYHELREL